MNNTTLKKFNLLDKNLVIKDTIVLYHKLKDKERIIDNLLTEDVFSKKNNILYLENINKISILDQVHSLNEMDEDLLISYKNKYWNQSSINKKRFIDAIKDKKSKKVSALELLNIFSTIHRDILIKETPQELQSLHFKIFDINQRIAEFCSEHSFSSNFLETMTKIFISSYEKMKQEKIKFSEAFLSVAEWYQDSTLSLPEYTSRQIDLNEKITKLSPQKFSEYNNKSKFFKLYQNVIIIDGVLNLDHETLKLLKYIKENSAKMGMVIIVLQNINMVDYIYNSDLSFLVSNFRRTIYPSNYAQYANYLRYQLKTLDNVEYILKTDSIRKKTYEQFI